MQPGHFALRPTIGPQCGDYRPAFAVLPLPLRADRGFSPAERLKSVPARLIPLLRFSPVLACKGLLRFLRDRPSGKVRFHDARAAPQQARKLA